jgi:protein O-mannosyl-transferase
MPATENFSTPAILSRYMQLSLHVTALLSMRNRAGNGKRSLVRHEGTKARRHEGDGVARFSLCLILLTFLAYLPALRAGWIWDDGDYVVNNSNLRDAAGLGRIWTDAYSNWQFYPMVFTTFWAEYHAWELRPLGYHLDNVLIQAVSSILLWRLLCRLELAPETALLAAAIFAVHPVQVETVAWIAERKNLLCGLFYLWAMLVYLRVVSGELRGPNSRRYLSAWLLYFCALLSKTVASTWPAVVLVLMWWKNGRVRQRDFWPLLPFFLAGGILSSITSHLEKYQVGANGKEWDFSFADRCIIAGRAIWFYLLKAIWPVHLIFIYPRWHLNEDRMLQAAIAASAVIVLIALILLARRIGRAPATAAMIFAGTLAPALGFVNFYPQRYSFVADHFQYLAIVALIVPAAFLLRKLAGNWAFVIVIPLAVLTWRRCLIYHNPITFWSDAVAQNGGSWMTHVSLGQQLELAGRPDEAEAEFYAATRAEPYQADPWYRLAVFQAMRRHQWAAAEASLRKTYQDDPDYRDPGAAQLLEFVRLMQHHGG